MLAGFPPDPGRWLPTGAARALSGMPLGGELLPVWAGGLLFAGYVAATVLAARPRADAPPRRHVTSPHDGTARDTNGVTACRHDRPYRVSRGRASSRTPGTTRHAMASRTAAWAASRITACSLALDSRSLRTSTTRSPSPRSALTSCPGSSTKVYGVPVAAAT